MTDWFPLEWSDDHLRAIRKIESAVLRGEVLALAMPRGSGKTTLIRAAILWAVLYGYRRFIVLIASDKDAAVRLLDGIKIALETNERLAELYPEACYPIRALEGKANKASGQILNGRRTHIVWKGPEIVLATVPGAKCSGAIIQTFGLLGRIRGANKNLPTGENLRPDLFMLDDVQTDQSAASATQVKRRLSLINGTVLGLAGPGKRIAGFAAVTVIQPDDVADTLLDRDKYPDWSGERCKLVYKWPSSRKAVEHWEHYGVLRAEGARAGRGLSEASAYYSKHRKVMDAGSLVAWHQRYNKGEGELSALQHAYNLRFQSPETFDAEFQNDPSPPDSDVERPTIRIIEDKLHGFPRATLPPTVTNVTAFIDVQGKALYYLVAGWESSTFTGYVLDYGTWPGQVANHFTLRNLSRTLAVKYPKRGLEGRLRAGLFDLVDHLGTARYKTPGGDQSNRIQLIGIDAAWGPSTKVVQSVCLEHKFGPILLPAFGRGLKPGSDNPMSEWKPKPGEKKGPFWIVRPTAGGGRHVIVDSNSAKSFVNARLNVALGDPGSLSLFTPKLRTGHRMIAEHWLAERVETISVNGGRSGEIFTLPPAKPDNHLWDTMVGAAVMASITGCNVPESIAQIRRRRPTRRRTTIRT